MAPLPLRLPRPGPVPQPRAPPACPWEGRVRVGVTQARKGAPLGRGDGPPESLGELGRGSPVAFQTAEFALRTRGPAAAPAPPPFFPERSGAGARVLLGPPQARPAVAASAGSSPALPARAGRACSGSCRGSSAFVSGSAVQFSTCWFSVEPHLF